MSTIKAPRGALDGEVKASSLVPDIVVGMHYKLLSYVCGPNCINPPPFTEPVTFTKIMTARPDGCRFAVVQRIGLKTAPCPKMSGNLTAVPGEPTGPIIVWDLHDEDLVRGRRTDGNGMMAPPPPFMRGESEDGVTMKVMMAYDE
jgi:hypothetical protein